LDSYREAMERCEAQMKRVQERRAKVARYIHHRRLLLLLFIPKADTHLAHTWVASHISMAGLQLLLHLEEHSHPNNSSHLI